ncbi:MAG: hypothetical protein J7K26_03520 [Candidatus Aenigmarchaeota archaeon]|nr:hypothetical protein [Candidatus Aenigmarchaeota archaeon]
MVIANYLHPERREAYLKNRLRLAKEKIKEFEILNKIVDNFNQIEAKVWIDNPLVFVAADAQYDLFYKAPNLMSLNYLKKIEEGLSLIDIFNMPKKRRNYLISRLRADKSEQVLSALSEVEIISYFIKKFGKENVIIEPNLESGKKPEIKLNFDRQEIYVEQTNIDIGIVERKLKEIFTKASEKIWHLIDDDIIIKFDIDTSKLVWDDEGYLNVASSVEKIINSLEKLNLHIFFRIEKTLFRLKSLTRLDSPEKYIIDKKDILQHYNEIGKILSENIDKEPFKSFCEKTKIRDIIDCPIVSFYSIPAQHKLVEIGSYDVFPSESALAQKRGFVNRIIKKIKQKINDFQREIDRPNILFIKARHWTMHGYSTDKDASIADIEFKPIASIIEEFFKLNKIRDLTAIILYENEPSVVRIMINPHAKNGSILSLEEIEQLFL